MEKKTKTKSKTAQRINHRLKADEIRRLAKMYMFYCTPNADYTNDKLATEILRQKPINDLLYEIDEACLNIMVENNSLKEAYDILPENQHAPKDLTNATFTEILNFIQDHNLNVTRAEIALKIDKALKPYKNAYIRADYEYNYNYACAFILEMLLNTGIDLNLLVNAYEKALKSNQVKDINKTVLFNFIGKN